MVLDLINLYKDKYKSYIVESKDYNELYKWEALQKFQENWDIESENFLEMYDNSFSDEIASKLWPALENFVPKLAMMEFIKLDSEKVRKMFRELFNEKLGVENRIEHFVFQCNEMRSIIRSNNPEFIDHFHDNFRIISVYLSFKYPMTYTIFKYTEFIDFMTHVKAKTIPGTQDIARFFKVMNTIYTIISKDEELMKVHNDLKKDAKYYQEDTLMLAQDIYWCSRLHLEKLKVKPKVRAKKK